jgi:SARP family transcriptional regulator, regulator of embCAB operon
LAGPVIRRLSPTGGRRRTNSHLTARFNHVPGIQHYEGETVLDINVLGPLDARVNGQSIVPDAAKPRQVLALLAMRAGQVVPMSDLIEELWEEHKPRAAVGTIQTYILALRRRIQTALPEDAGDEAKSILSTRRRGYMLDIPPTNVDAHRYHSLATAGEKALADRDYESASRMLHTALECWRGPALVDVNTGPCLGIELTWLEQSRLVAMESRVEADLHLGRHHQILGELAELTARYPLHEMLCAQYMTALTACGQRWRALEAFRTLRKNLVATLGLEPSVHVHRLHRAILNAEVLPASNLTFFPAERTTG